ncbi:hypothetical protein SAMN02745857_00842 [Andreprevotia lacus DSM 23236]|jgi:hypothetical protein|uniref:Uncharacterized protein n=1 Tax=Andreprevotia lacus DSM 23236 TaxID=1121001 RepID=A0A1W1X8A9_9NEIS|nr:hypothetical protein [Andreprevotia lacus]SMC20166.1 hypothetical protein SAMN02745857_00842 [Andreprevotia lacus DSM 23236]
MSSPASSWLSAWGIWALLAFFGILWGLQANPWAFAGMVFYAVLGGLVLLLATVIGAMLPSTQPAQPSADDAAPDQAGHEQAASAVQDSPASLNNAPPGVPLVVLQVAAAAPVAPPVPLPGWLRGLLIGGSMTGALFLALVGVAVVVTNQRSELLFCSLFALAGLPGCTIGGYQAAPDAKANGLLLHLAVAAVWLLAAYIAIMFRQPFMLAGLLSATGFPLGGALARRRSTAAAA